MELALARSLAVRPLEPVDRDRLSWGAVECKLDVGHVVFVKDVQCSEICQAYTSSGRKAEDSPSFVAPNVNFPVI